MSPQGLVEWRIATICIPSTELESIIVVGSISALDASASKSAHVSAGASAGIGEIRQLIQNMSEGQRDGLSKLFTLTNAKIFGVCLRIVGDETVAEDIMQETYLTVWNKSDTFDASRASPITWMCAIARNKAVDHLRRQRGELDAGLDEVPDLPDLAPDPEAAADLSGKARRLSDCLGKLPADISGAIRQAFWNGSTYAELAHASDMPLSSMKSRIRRSLASLKTCMEPQT